MTVKQADKQADRRAGRQASRQTYIQTDRHDRQAGRQTGRQEVPPLITARVSLSVDESASNIRWRGNYMTAIISSGL